MSVLNKFATLVALKCGNGYSEFYICMLNRSFSIRGFKNDDPFGEIYWYIFSYVPNPADIALNYPNPLQPKWIISLINRRNVAI